ncbi:MAG TPA: hypothetical protein VE463_10175, partial [Blastococcus sp.]|nr:hypothetical protein [Blastococcus sp.]
PEPAHPPSRPGTEPAGHRTGRTPNRPDTEPARHRAGRPPGRPGIERAASRSGAAGARRRVPRRVAELGPRSHGEYVAKVARSAASLVAQRFITAYDAADIVREAARAEVP